MVSSSELVASVPALQGTLEGVVEEEVEAPGGAGPDDVRSEALVEPPESLPPDYAEDGGEVGRSGAPAQSPLVLVYREPEVIPSVISVKSKRRV